MNIYNKENWAGLMIVSLAGLALLFSCSKDEIGHGLGSVPKAAFTATVASDGHSVSAVNKTSSPVIVYWSVPSLNLGFADLKGETADLNFIFPGTYKITMMVAGRGGTDSVSQKVTTTLADPTACDPTKALGFIASCTSKTWKLIPAAGAYKVGPAANDGSWWSNGTGDVTARACEFDDEYTFSFNAAHTFVYNSHGDFYGDGYMGDNTSSCQPESNFTSTQAPWGSGTFSYTVINGTGLNHLGQLKVIGLGAHMGLQKVTSSDGEKTSGPVSSITYDILSMTQDPGGDILVLGVNLGYGWWTFTFKSI